MMQSEAGSSSRHAVGRASAWLAMTPLGLDFFVQKLTSAVRLETLCPGQQQMGNDQSRWMESAQPAAADEPRSGHHHRRKPVAAWTEVPDQAWNEGLGWAGTTTAGAAAQPRAAMDQRHRSRAAEAAQSLLDSGASGGPAIHRLAGGLEGRGQHPGDRR